MSLNEDFTPHYTGPQGEHQDGQEAEDEREGKLLGLSLHWGFW